MSPSILYITSTQAVGFSPVKGGRVTTLPADATGDIGLSIEALLAAMPGRQKHIYVLTTEVWSQAVTIESRSLRRIDSAQIPQMLAFEAESFSGIPASAARTAILPLDAGPLETSFWVSQLDSARFAQAADAVAFNGGKLLGILHPAGLPSAITGGNGNWTRLEQWDDANVVVSRQGRGTPTRTFIDELQTSIDSSAAARDHLLQTGVETGTFVELLKQSGDLTATGSQSDGYASLMDENSLKTFLAAWSKALQKPKNLPVIVPVRSRASAKTKRTLTLAATAAAIVGIACHHHFTKTSRENRVAELNEEVAELKGPIDSFSALQTQISEIDEDIEETSQKLSDLEIEVVKYTGQLGIHRSRMAAFLKTLGDFEIRPHDLMISGIRNERNVIRVVGRSISSEAITQFATELAARLAPLNLSIEVPRREALLMSYEGGPYEFEYVISDGA